MKTHKLGLAGLALLALVGCAKNKAGTPEKAQENTILSGIVTEENYQKLGGENGASSYAFLIETETGEKKVIEIRNGYGNDGTSYYKESVDLLVNKGNKIKIDLKQLKLQGYNPELNSFSFQAGNFFKYAKIE